MKRLFLLLFIFMCFAAGANAQLCGQFTTTINIRTDYNKAIENAKVLLVAIGDDEINGKTFARDDKDASAFFIKFGEGHTIKGAYKLIVSAPGFLPDERKITFPHCKNQDFNIYLRTDQRKNNSVLRGTVYDAQGSLVVGAKVTVTNKKGDKFATRTNDEGVYHLSLPFNNYSASSFDFEEAKYDIIVESNGFKRSVTKDFVFIPSQSGYMQLDLGLEIGRIIDTIPVSSKKTGKKSKN